MKIKSKDLDVDFIGGQEPMTKDEALIISKFIMAQKNQQTKKKNRQKTSARRKIIAQV